MEKVGASVKGRGGPWLSVPARSRRSALAAMAVGFAFSVPRTRARVREPLRASERADGPGLLGVDRGQRHQAGHGVWRARGGSGLWPVGHCADSEFSIQRSQPSLTAHFHSIETTKPLIISKNILNENCSPSYSLQFLLKDQDLILKGS